MRLVFAGTPEVAVPALEKLHQSSHDVVAVITRPDAPAGRGRRLTPSPVAQRAAQLGIEVLTPTSVRDEAFVAQLSELAPDCCPVVAYGNLIPAQALAVPVHGWVNLHFSLLPRWRGAAPVQRAIMAGDETTGAVTFRLVPALDAGAILGRFETHIAAHETAGDLLERLAISGADLLLDTIDRLADGTATEESQDEAGVTHAAKITTDDARIRWGEDAATVDRLIRGCQPAPGAWTTLDGERFKIHRARVVESIDGAPGSVLIGRKSVQVACGEGALELLQVQAHGRKAMGAGDWARGRHDDTPVVFD